MISRTIQQKNDINKFIQQGKLIPIKVKLQKRSKIFVIPPHYDIISVYQTLKKHFNFKSNQSYYLTIDKIIIPLGSPQKIETYYQKYKNQNNQLVIDLKQHSFLG